MLEYRHMMTFLAVAALLALFYALGRSADIVVERLRGLAKRLGIGVGLLGFILGAFTTLPEMAIAVNAVALGMPAVSYGNLIGGIPVILGLVLGLNLVLNRRVEIERRDAAILSFIAAYLLLPLLLGRDGRLDLFDGAGLIVGYALLIVGFFWGNGRLPAITVDVSSVGERRREILVVALGALAVIVTSDLIVRLTEYLLGLYPVVPAFLVGLLLFALGTNLPEISVAISSWRRGVGDLSVHHLFGSAMANVLLLGLLAFLKPLQTGEGSSYRGLIAAYVILLGTLAVFSWTGRRLTRVEGAALLALYAAFFVSQAVLAGWAR